MYGFRDLGRQRVGKAGHEISPARRYYCSTDSSICPNCIGAAGLGFDVRVALGFVYGRSVEIYGPVFQSYKVEGGKVRVSFTHVGQGLASRPADKLQGFALAGEDRKWTWADAVIDGNTVVLSSDRVPAPVAVRYAWAAA